MTISWSQPRTAATARAACAALLLVLGGCAGSSGAVQGDPGLVHVHGLGEEPGSGTVFAATHTGLFRIAPGGPPERVGEYFHDLMGFTVLESGEMLASGHPDLRAADLQREGAPPLLGLVTSRDGVEWTPRSLLGEVDFHTLSTASGTVYGLDATTGQVLASDDLQTWEARSREPLTDLAVDPQDPDVVVGTGEDGVVRSTDGARTWSSAGTDALAWLTWAEHGLYGVAANGTVMASDDGGSTWEPRGGLGPEVEAFEAVPSGRLLAADGAGVQASEDGGVTWTAVASS